MHPHIARRLREAQPSPVDMAAARRAYIEQFAALPAAERELALLENKDARWSDADRARYRALTKSDGDSQ